MYLAATGAQAATGPDWAFWGVIVGALIALLGTVITIGFNSSRFNTAEKNQTTRHNETTSATKQLGGREQLLTDLRRAEEAIRGNDKYEWVWAGGMLDIVNKSEYATDDDVRRARAAIEMYAQRVTPQAPSRSRISQPGGGIDAHKN